jgi:ribosomal protein S18 acetylase RimI-like enzyme
VSAVDWREYDPDRDRLDALEILRELLRRGPVPATIHPGEWDWWVYHPDPRQQRYLVAPGALAMATTAVRALVTFGAPVPDGLVLGRELFGDQPWTLLGRSDADTEAAAALRAAGAEPTGGPWPQFLRPTAGGVPDASLPAGFAVRPVAGAAEHAARAGAARRAFQSTLDKERHDARYLDFMRSPGYARADDLVVVAPDGRIAAFAITWRDRELSLAQFEPVGTDPDFHRRGLGRALLAVALERLAAVGIRTARVLTNPGNDAAAGLYRAAGFTETDRLYDWAVPAP